MYSKFFTRLFLLIGMMGFLSISTLAQGIGDIVEIGQATTITTLAPIYTPHDYSVSQQLYTADEIGASGTINSIAFHWAYNGSKTYGIDVYMKHTERTYFETTNDRIPLSASDKVYTGTLNPSNDGWVTITLDTPFEYDGSNSLVIAVDRNSGSPGFSELDNNWNVIGTWYYTATANYTILYIGNSTDVDPFSPPYMTPSNYRPNIRIELTSSVATCKTPKNFAASDVTTNSAILTWNAGSEDQSNWDVYLTQSSTDVPDENTTPSYQVTECTKALTGLTAQTTYYAYVRAACSSTDKSRWVSTNFTTTREALIVNANNPYEQDFETNNDWSFTNGTVTNQWYWGNATNNGGGSKALYISNDNGTNNQYTLNSASVVFASKLFNFDQGTYTFVFDWKGYGESTYDYLRAALVPGDAEFTAGTSLPSGVTTTGLPNTWIALDGEGKLNLKSNWQTQTAEVPVSGNYTMVFIWRNDNGSGTQPPAAIDNISISKLSCSRPTNVVVDAATLTWTPGDTGQNAWEISLCTITNPETGTITTVTGEPTYTYSDLTPETQYYAYIRSDCGSENGKSSWSDVASIYLGYCQPAPTSVDKKGITNVTFGTGDEIVNNSNYPTSNPYYGNYSNLVGAVAASETATVSITYETGYTYGTLVWVDWNNNYEFEDSEIVYSGTSTNANPTTLVASFIVPATQAEGYYRMRIGGADSYFDSFIGGNTTANHDPCSSGSYKVFHDYTLHVLPVPACPTPTSFAASNVAATSATLSWTENGTSTNWVLQYGIDASFATYSEKTNGFNMSGNNISIGITDLAGDTQYYARVKSVNGSDESEWATCDFTTLPTCPAPTGLSASKTGTTITLSWTAGAAGQNAWDIRYKKSTDSEYTFVHLENQTTTSYTITDLSPVTTYGVNVRAWCDEEDQSKWGYSTNQNTDLSVTTECATLTLPYTCDFEGPVETSGHFSNYPVPKCWDRIEMQYGNYPYSYYPYVYNYSSDAHGGTKSLRMYRTPNSANETIIMPEIDEQYEMSDLQIRFWAKAGSSNNTLSVGVMENNVFNEVQTVEGISTAYAEFTVTLTDYAGNGRNIAIKCGSSDNYLYYYIDDITVEVIPSCLIPTGLTNTDVDVFTASFVWQAGNDETEWNFQYKKTSESEWGEIIHVTELPTVDNPFVLTGLQRGIEYEARIQAYCDAEDQSEWNAMPVSFTTDCGIWTIDGENTLFEDFNESTFPPACWNWIRVDNYYGWQLSTNVYNPLDPQGTAYSYWPTGETYLILPHLHIDGAVTLNFDMAFSSSGAGEESSVVLSTTGIDPLNFSNTLWTATEFPTSQTNVNVDLSAYNDMDVYIAFKYVGAGTSGRTWYVNNVEVSVPVAPQSQQNVDLVEGWNWFSSYLEITLDDLKAALVESLGNTNINITSGNGQSAIYNGSRWRGYLTSLEPTLMYKIETTTTGEMVLFGEPLDPAEHPVTITQNNNWIAYPFSESMTIENAFAGFAVNGDMIISGNGQSTTYTNRWRGYLTTLEPGQGYIYKSNTSESRTFAFPSNDKSLALHKATKEEPESHWSDFVSSQYKDQLPVVSFIQLNGNYIAAEDRWNDMEIAAFVDGQCRGHAFMHDETDFGDPYPHVMVGVFYNNVDEVVSFKMYDHATGMEYDNCISNIEILTGYEHVELYFDYDEAVVLNFTTSSTSTFTKEIIGFGEGNGRYYLIASPIDDLNPAEVDGMIAEPAEDYDLYWFDQTEELEWRNYKQGEGFNLVSGMGYLYANKYDVILTFSGTPVEGDTYEVSLVKDDDVQLSGWNLVGNPFTDTAYIGREFYIMNPDGDRIIAATKDGIPAMEGAFVIAETDGEELTFSTQAPLPSPQKGGGIVLNLSQSRGIIDRAIVRFGDGRSLPKFQLNPNNSKVYIPQEGKDYAVVNMGGDGACTVSTEIPVHFKAEMNGIYTLTISSPLTSNLSPLTFKSLHLVDNKTGDDIDLLVTPQYSFEASVTDQASRFKIVFTTQQESDGHDDFAFLSDGKIMITGDHPNATLQITDLTGRIVLRGDDVHIVSTTNMAPGVYVLHLTTGNTTKTQKIVIE